MLMKRVIQMTINYNIDALEHIINDLSCLTGLRINFLDTSFRYLVCDSNGRDYCSIMQEKEGKRDYCKRSDMQLLLKCRESRKLESHICYAGLYDAAMPIIKNSIIAGYVIFGRIRTANSPKKQIYENSEYKEILNKKYKELTFMTLKQIESLYDLLPRILFQNAIEIEHDEFITEITEYINNNLSSDLKISVLCKKFIVPKNRLYDAFKNHFGYTVNEYITNKRLEKAKELLKQSKEPIYKIAETVGFANFTYFCKLFKRKTGLSPSNYRVK